MLIIFSIHYFYSLGTYKVPVFDNLYLVNSCERLSICDLQ